MRYNPEEIDLVAQPIVEEYEKLSDELYMLIVLALMQDKADQGELYWLASKQAETHVILEKSSTLVNHSTERMAYKLDRAVGKVESSTKGQVAKDLGNYSPKVKQRAPIVNNFAQNWDKSEVIRRIKSATDTVNATMLDQVQAEYVKAINAIYKDLASSHISLEKAVNRALTPLADSGLTGFVDKSGRNWQPDVYMRTVMKNSMKQYHNYLRLEGFIDQGVELVIVSEHPASRPSHYPMQNKVYSLNPSNHSYPYIAETGIGEPAGLLGINCRHFLMPFYEGMKANKPRYSVDENEQMYSLLQEQRYQERSIRAHWRKEFLARQTEDFDEAKRQRLKIKTRRKELNQLIKQGNDEYGNFLTRQKEKERSAAIGGGV